MSEAIIWLPSRFVSRRDVWALFGGLTASAGREGFNAKRLAEWRGPPAKTVIAWGWGQKWMPPAFHLSETRVGFDLGYWRREIGYHRISINDRHPWRFVREREWPPDRFDALGLQMREAFSPDGHVLLIGQGRKSVDMFNEQPGEWERMQLARIRSAYPGREIRFRPKPGNKHLKQLDGVVSAEGPLDRELDGCALVVCRHSNVALDAILAGVPVSCENGIARAVCSSALPADPRPLPERDRLLVLRASAWWQWTPKEAREGKVWRFLREMADDL